MRIRWAVRLGLVLFCVTASLAGAQDTPPPIGPFVVDVRGTLPRFKQDLELAESRGLGVDELPGTGVGFDVNAHLYLLRWKAVTFGLGGQLTVGRSQSDEARSLGVVVSRAVTERFTSIAPQLSFNFGTGNGWSYISGGIGSSRWSVVPDGSEPLPPDEEWLTTINYGVGARWFAKPHLAFTFDFRFYAIDPSTPVFGLPPGPRTTMTVLGAGISLK